MEEEPPPQSRVGATVAPALDAEQPGGAGGGLGEGVLLLLFTILTLAASAFLLIRSEQDAVSDPAEKAARGEITGLHDQSLLRRVNLERALQEVSGDLVTNIHVAPERMSVTVRNADGERRVVTIDPAFDTVERDFGVGEDNAVRPSDVDARGPERMARAVAKRTGLPFGAIDYATMSFPTGSEPTWYMALDSGPARSRQWVAEADGSDVRRPGELSARQTAENERSRRQAERERRRIELVFERRTRCLRRAADAEAISRCIARYAR